VAIFEVVDDRGLPFTARVATWLPPATPSSLGMTRDEFQALRLETQQPFDPRSIYRPWPRRLLELWIFLYLLARVGIVRIVVFVVPVVGTLILICWFVRTRTLLAGDWWRLRLALLRRGRCAACGQPLRDGSRVCDRLVCPECGAHWEVVLTQPGPAGPLPRTAGERVSSTLLS
jgi:hypothetical protein